MGANFVRVECLWNQIETAPGVFSATALSKIDAQVAAYQAQGLKVLIDFHQAGLSPYFGGASGVPSWYYADGRFDAKTVRARPSPRGGRPSRRSHSRPTSRSSR